MNKMLHNAFHFSGTWYIHVAVSCLACNSIQLNCKSHESTVVSLVDLFQLCKFKGNSFNMTYMY